MLKGALCVASTGPCADPASGSLPAVVSLRLGMNEDLEQLRRGLLEADLERGRDIVDAPQLQVVSHGAVTGHVNLVADAFDLNLMHIQHFGEFLQDGLELVLERGIAQDLVPGFDSGGFALNVAFRLCVYTA